MDENAQLKEYLAKLKGDNESRDSVSKYEKAMVAAEEINHLENTIKEAANEESSDLEDDGKFD